MKLRFFVLLLFLNLAGYVGAQEPLLQRTIDLNLTDASLDEILREITRQSGINFSYNSREIQNQKKISLNLKSENLELVLNKLAAEFAIEYKVVRAQIVIRKAKQIISAPTYTINGVIKDRETGETLPGVNIYETTTHKGTTTNSYGFFSLTLPEGNYSFILSYLGYRTVLRSLELNRNIRLNEEMEYFSTTLGEIIITESDNPEILYKNIERQLALSPRLLEQLPDFAGENGLIKSLQTIPGIQTHSDGSAFFYVRGGNKDQNLILVDEAPVFNPAHLFGFYSVIIPETAKEINVYKADMPIHKAGRISSLIDVQTRDGNMKNFAMDGVLNPLVSRISMETPLVKDKSSVFASLRRSNFKWIYQRNAPNSDFYIQDVNFKFNWQINNNNRVYWSVFNGLDNYTSPGNFGKVGIGWQNLASTIRWSSIVSNRLFSNLTLYGSGYEYILYTGGPQWKSGINHAGIKYDFSFFKNPDVTYRFGFSQTANEFNPGNLTGLAPGARRIIPSLYVGRATETVVYISYNEQINNKWSWGVGANLPVWISRGPAVVYRFDEQNKVSDTLVFQHNQPIKYFINPDLRLSTRYRLNQNSSIHLNAGRYHQNLHLLSNSISPFSSFEIWMPSGLNIKPQRAIQLSVGYSSWFPINNLEFTADAYMKQMTNQIEYADHAVLLMNPLIDGELKTGTTNAWGVELMLKRNKGRLTGWLGYTWSRSLNRFPEINNNMIYPSFHDRPHNISTFLSWALRPRLILSATWVYHTGSAVTTPVGFYQYNGNTVPIYGRKNNDRLPDYHRLDLSLNWILSKSTARYQHSIDFGIYNLYNRHNPVSLNFNKLMDVDGSFVVQENMAVTPELVTTQKYLSTIMPTISYKFKLR